MEKNQHLNKTMFQKLICFSVAIRTPWVMATENNDKVVKTSPMGVSSLIID